MQPTNLQPTDYAVTLAAWRERNRGKWRGMDGEGPLTLRQMRKAIKRFITSRELYTPKNEGLTRALYAAIQAEGRR